MPRDGSGNYSLPAGINPVIASTLIESDGWANPTLTDIAAALTDSLSRTGAGGMLVPLKFADGTVGTPGISWVNEPTSGWYRYGLNDFRYSVGNEDIFKITKNGIELASGKTALNITSYTRIQDAMPPTAGQPTVKAGEDWYESDTGALYMRYQNPDTTYTWVQINGEASGDYILSATKGQPNGVASLDATGKVPTAQLPTTGGANAQIFTANGTWTKPAGCTVVRVVCIGAGGGGAGGSGAASGNNRVGGAGGGGGARAELMMAAADLPSTVTITVGAVGTGSAGNLAGSVVPATAGGTSSFGSILSAYGGGGGAYNGSGGGGGGTGGVGGTGGGGTSTGGLPAATTGIAGWGGQGAGATTTGNVAGKPAEFGGGAGGLAGNTAASALNGSAGGGSLYGAPGGGGGASISAAGAGYTGAAGGLPNDYTSGGGGAFGTGLAGAAGTNGAAGDSTKCGQGGGGGAANTGGVGGVGGNGGAPGGGGGGGGGGTGAGVFGGKGGDGGRGEVRVYAW